MKLLKAVAIASLAGTALASFALAKLKWATHPGSKVAVHMTNQDAIITKSREGTIPL